MFNLFIDFHWPTFFTSLVIFILVANLFNLVKVSFIRQRHKTKLRKIDRSMKDLLSNLGLEDKKIDELIKNINSSLK
ncbi:hypothetical protein ACFL31_00035 [Candidatus Margulisiibacteriota bacterium]